MVLIRGGLQFPLALTVRNNAITTWAFIKNAIWLSDAFDVQALLPDCYSLRTLGQKLLVDALFGVISNLVGLIENAL